jgi:hypothetical protein
VRLFPAICAIERQYFRATRMYPPQHLIVRRREVCSGTNGSRVR